MVAYETMTDWLAGRHGPVLLGADLNTWRDPVDLTEPNPAPEGSLGVQAVCDVTDEPGDVLHLSDDRVRRQLVAAGPHIADVLAPLPER